MHNGKCRTLRTELANTCQGGEPPGDTPRDQLMEAWGTPGAEENTTAPEGNNPDTRADDHIEQLQTWFTQEAEKELQEVTRAGKFDHHQSPLLWQLYQRKIAAARTKRPWKGRLPTLGQMQEESGISAASY